MVRMQCLRALTLGGGGGTAAAPPLGHEHSRALETAPLALAVEQPVQSLEKRLSGVVRVVAVDGVDELVRVPAGSQEVTVSSAKWGSGT